METPEVIDLRKSQRKDADRPLYTVPPRHVLPSDELPRQLLRD